MAKGKYPKEPTFRYFIQDKQGNAVNIDTLSEQECEEVGLWAYRTMLKQMGYVPVTEDAAGKSTSPSGESHEKIKERCIKMESFGNNANRIESSSG